MIQTPRRYALRRTGPALRSGIVLAGLALFLTGCGGAPHHDAAADERRIVEALEGFPVAIAARDVDAACDLFAEDAILVYPGTPDRDRDAFCRGLNERLGDADFTLSYEPPEIQQVVIDGDTAAVRLIWTGTATSAGGEAETWREQGLDVLVRDTDERWRILISHAFPLQD